MEAVAQLGDGEFVGLLSTHSAGYRRTVLHSNPALPDYGGILETGGTRFEFCSDGPLRFDTANEKPQEIPMNKRVSLTVACLLIFQGVAALAQPGSLQDLSGSLADKSLPTVTIYKAKEIVTLDPARPTAEAVAVVGDRILATGTLAELKAAIGDQKFTVDERFADQVIVPGFIGQHDHPLLAGLTMIAEIISIEDWVLPSGTVPAAKNREEYLKRLAAANAKLEDPEAVLLTWGFHHYFHGKLTRADLDRISTTRPIIVWHRSAHEFILNSATMKKFGVTREWYATLKGTSLEQSNFEEAHYWEQGAFSVMPLIASAIATPERLRQGLEFVERYFHANGITRVANRAGSCPSRCRRRRTQS